MHVFACTETIGRQRDGDEAGEAWVSVSLDDHRLKDARSYSVGQMRPAEGCGPVFADKQSQVAVFVVAAVKVLALYNRVHDGVCIDAGVVHAARLPLHGFLLPSGGSVGQDGRSRGGRRSLRLGEGRLVVWFSGGGGRRLGGVAKPAGGATARGGIPVVAEIVQAGAARVTGAVT